MALDDDTQCSQFDAQVLPPETQLSSPRWTNTEMLDKVYNRPRPADLVEKVKAFSIPLAGPKSVKSPAPRPVAAPAPTTIESDVEVTEDHWLRLMGG